MRNYGIDALKDGHPQYNSGMSYSFDSYKQSIEKMYKNRKETLKKQLAESENLKIQAAKKKDDNIQDKFVALTSDEESRGNLLIRYLYLEEPALSYEMRQKRDEDMKEITRLGKVIGLNFGKKAANHAYFGAFSIIFNQYLSCPKEITPEAFQSLIQEAIPDFEITINDEILGRMQILFEYIFKKSFDIMTTQIYDPTGCTEFSVPKFEFEFQDVAEAYAATYEVPVDELEIDMEFNDLDIQNEYLNRETVGDMVLLFRGGRKEGEMVEREEQVTAELGTAEDVANLAKIEDLIPLEAKNTHNQDSDAQTHALTKDIKSDTPFKEFYNRFSSTLCKNEYWQVNLFNCLDMLSDLGKPTDLLFDQMLSYFEGEIEPVMFLSEHRQEIVADFIKTKKDMEKKKSKKAGKKMISNMRGLAEGGDDDLGRTNHEVLAMLGMSEKDIKQEEKLGLHGKVVAYNKHVEQTLEETYGRTEEDLFDFVNLRSDQVQAKVGSSYTKADFANHIVFDCMPETKVELTGNLFKVSEFPSHISSVFGDIEYLNHLQTQVKDVAFDTDENMLVCAPTGAGKTNVALLTILREFNKTFDTATRKTGDFKIVYISPLKALATEIVEKFTSKLGFAGVVVKEFTGDMSLTRQELLETHIIVSTPEKWDVMTRKSDIITELVKMIIIDEIHLLDEERGRVLECIVARTLITIERKQKNIRLVGLSATLPNYVEVANFLQVKKGLFYFNESFRPVPLYKKFIGVRNPREMKKPEVGLAGGGEEKKNKRNRGPDQKQVMDEVLYNLVRDNLTRKEQILIFVHSRKDTVKVGLTLIDMAMAAGDTHLFTKPDNPIKENLLVNRDLKALVAKGLGAHNAGLCRKDRRLIESGFLDGTLRIVTCTATLAWGVNLPAHTVIIKGTDVYEPGVGFKDLSILDVQQIFGRAGRPQFDSYGEAILITKIERLNYFMGMMTLKTSIQSKFEGILLEALNAEISLGNITTLSEALDYVQRTFYYVRARKNPRSVGAKNQQEAEEKVHGLIEEKLNYLNDLKFIRYDRNNLLLESTELGRICSHFYVNCQTMEKFCKYLNFYEEQNVLGVDPSKNNVDTQGDIEDQDLLAILAQASEFEQLQVRPEEVEELKKTEDNCEFLEPVHKEFKKLIGVMEKKLDEKMFEKFKEENFGGGTGNMDSDSKADRAMDSYKKVMILVQGYLSMQSYDNYSLVADTHYIVQNGTRILRCLFSICLKKNLAYLCMTVLRMCRFIENNIRDDLTCLRMFCYENVKRGILSIRRGQDIKDSRFFLEDHICKKIENKMYGEHSNYNLYGSVRNMREDRDIGHSLRLTQGEAGKLKRILHNYPLIDVEYTLRPIAQTIIKVDLKVIPEFSFNRTFHLGREEFVLIVEDGGEILHHEDFGIITKNLVSDKDNAPIELSFFIPFKERAESYTLHIMSDRFVGADLERELSLKEVMIHTEKMEYTNLLDLRPLKVATLNNPAFERLYKIKYFNPIQTQVFHALYYTDNNCLVGAPTGSGKTIMSELAMLRIFGNYPKQKIVYIGPYKALVKERLTDWKRRLETKEMGKKVVELTGDYTPDLEALLTADVLVTTPEKWDGISRNWQSRNYVQSVGLIIFDEIHLLGQDRGPVIEVIVSRMNYIAAKTLKKIRFIGLSTAMASGADVANWFGVPKHFMFNFRPNVRPVPVDIHFKGFSDRNYCPRMNSMNKPAFNDIKKFSPHQPVLIFVSSRRQTRLTALDLITLTANESYGRSGFLRMTEDETAMVINEVQDSNLKQTLSFGIGMHHAGLIQSDRKIVEELFVENKIQILVATSTLAWGVNFPAKLVIVKGTEFFDPKLKGYVDMPITDILQMVGRAGRPQYNDKGFACVYVEKSKKNFYRKYLNDPFPIESRLTTQIAEHINAEINSGTITNKQNFMDYLTWTYWFRRISRNPLYYEIQNGDSETIKKHVMDLIDKTCNELRDSGTIEIGSDDFELSPTFYGHLASFYYIQHKSIKFIASKLKENLSIYQLIEILSHFEEYDEVPMRHNEENLNAALANICPFAVDKNNIDSPKIKALLLFQAYFSGLPLPIRDYITDTKLVLDASVRFLQAMIDFCAEKGFLNTLLNLMSICQMLTQGCWMEDSCLVNIPHFSEEIVSKLASKHNIKHLCQLIEVKKSGKLKELLKSVGSLKESHLKEAEDCIQRIPDVSFRASVFSYDSEELTPVLKAGQSIDNLDEVYVVIDAKRHNHEYPLKVSMKKLTKVKDFSWWIVVCNFEEGKVYSLKKTFFKTHLHREFQVSITASKSKHLDILLVSDSYIGLDQITSIDLSSYITKNPPKPRTARPQAKEAHVEGENKK